MTFTSADLRGAKWHSNMPPGSALAPPTPNRRAKRGTGTRAMSKRRKLDNMHRLGLPEICEGPRCIQYRGHDATMRNSWEKRFAAELAMQQAVGIIRAWAYEAMRFQVGWGAWYTPDFVVIDKDGVRCYDVKGFRREAGILRIKTAAMIYPEYRWLLAKLVKGAWQVESINEKPRP